MHTLVQRGVVSFGLYDAGRRCSSHWVEAWLCKPVQVTSTAAAGLYMGVTQAMPNCCSVADLECMKELASKVSSFSFMPCCARASSNISMLKYRAALWEETVLPLPETEGIHLYHRAKMQVSGLKRHTMRHFNIANLYRLSSIQGRMVQWIEERVPSLVRRVVGPTRRTWRTGCSSSQTSCSIWMRHTINERPGDAGSNTKTCWPCARLRTAT